MKTFSVRMYSLYVDEFEVEAETRHEALALANSFRQGATPVTGVEQIAFKEFSDTDSTYVTELDEYGSWLDDTEEF